jgi:hypothetical protein
MKRLCKLTFILALTWGILPAGAEAPRKGDADRAKAVATAREKGLAWLTNNQMPEGCWNKEGHSLAVASFACLSYLAACDEPYTGDRGRALVKGLQFILTLQKDGMFVQQGHTWIHGQGFGTLALAEAYGRSLSCKTKPDLDMKMVRDVLVKAVAAIAKHQSQSGGWWYTPGFPEQHEGSTTVCAVQALVSAQNFGIPIDEKVLDRGFEYLKKCQTEDGGFEYKLGDRVSMKEGTAADVATLGLMKKFDYVVMVKGYQFLLKTTPATISGERFPYYGHFYGCMGMHLLGQEYQQDKEYREKTKGYILGAQKDLLAWQNPDGTWPLKGWFASGSQENASYSTAFATLTLGVPESRLSITNRTPPNLPR